MSQSSLSARLSGSVAWDVDDLDRIARFFKIRAAQLFGESSDPPSAHNPRIVKLVPDTPGQTELALSYDAPWEPQLVRSS